MQCPQCAGQLSQSTYESIAVHTCGHCGGEFMDGQSLAAIVQHREHTLPADMRDALAEAKPFAGVSESQKQRELTCPACSNPMNVINYCGDTGVFVDRCTVCNGIWLDQDELEQIQVLMEKWADDAPAQIRGIADKLEESRRVAAGATGGHYGHSRFAFVNALINRFLDAA